MNENDGPLKVMMVDDNPDDRALVLRELEKQFDEVEAQEVINKSDFANYLEKGNFDIVITDYRLRWTDGLDILREVKSQYPEKPVIMFTGTGTEQVAVDAMKKGLDDYIVKSPKHFIRLPASVKSIMERVEEKEEAEKAIKETELKYRTIFENTATAKMIFDKDGLIKLVNKEFEKLSGYSKDEVQDELTWHKFIIDEDEVMELCEQVEKCEGIPRDNIRVEFVNRYGDTRDILIAIGLIPHDSKCVASILDITKFKETVDALNISEEMFRLVFEDSPLGIALVSLEGEFIDVNRSMMDIFGYNENDFLNLKYNDIIHPEDRNKIRDEFELISSGKKGKVEIKTRCLNKNDEIIELKFLISLVKDQKGEPHSVMVQVYRDVNIK